MKKSYGIIIWIIALAALMIAAYTFYAKNKIMIINPPLQQNTTQQQNTTIESTIEKSSTMNETSQVEKILAPDFTLKDLDGKEVKLSDYRGKIVILNFWAVWCKYCIQEMPDLNTLNEELKKEDDAVIVAVDVQEKPDTVREYLTSNNITLKVLLDEDGSVAEAYGIDRYPATFIVNKDGSLYTYIPGATDIKTLRMILDKARKGEPIQ